ncbi:MAG: SsrA-binding protein SmpB [Firmicutes bacterium]|nr:SsrA-binding protein SmpB [Bacillota bacterium]
MEEKKITTKTIVANKRAAFEFFILDRYEAGVVLDGGEVKSIRAGKLNLSDSFVVVENRTPVLRNAHIAPYTKGSYFNSDSRRDRVLLLNRKEIVKIYAQVREKGLAVIPLRAYFYGSLIKIEIGVCRGKQLHDKRDALKQKDLDRQSKREMAEYR